MARFGCCPLVIGGVVPEVEGLGTGALIDGGRVDCSFALLLTPVPDKITGGSAFAGGSVFAGGGVFAGRGAFSIRGPFATGAVPADTFGSFIDHLGNELIISETALLFSYSVDVLG